MPPVLGHVERHDDEVSDAHADLLLTTRAEVRLARLEGVDERDFEIFPVAAYPSSAHSTRRITTTNAEATSTKSDVRRF